MSKAREEAKRLIVETKIYLQLDSLIIAKQERLNSFEELLKSAITQLKQSQNNVRARTKETQFLSRLLKDCLGEEDG